MTTNAQWTAIRKRVFKEQEGKCATCWRMLEQHPYHAHHAIIPKGQTNYAKYKKWLDMAENIVLVCRICHSQHGDLTNSFKRDMFWTDKIDLGYDMQGWYDSIPMIDKSHYFIYLGKEENGNKDIYKSQEGNIGS